MSEAALINRSDRAQPIEATGRLSLGVGRRPAGESYACRQFHEGALRVMRPHYLDDTGQVSYTVINPGGGYLGGDHYEVDLTVEQDASLLLTTQSATKVYRTPQGPATQMNRITLHPGATLESLPDQLIVYRQGSYRQHTIVTMDPAASLVLAEVITPGWSPDGQSFGYHELRLRTEVLVGLESPELFVLDQLRVVPDSSTCGLGVMEGHSHTGQLLVIDARVDDALLDEVADLAQASGALAAVSRVGAALGAPSRPMAPGLMLRALGHDTATLTQLNLDVVNLLRDRWRGQGPVDLRKY